jgi:hypothetical protein
MIFFVSVIYFLLILFVSMFFIQTSYAIFTYYIYNNCLIKIQMRTKIMNKIASIIKDSK